MIKFVERLKENEQPYQKKVEEKRIEKKALQDKLAQLMANVKALQEQYIETLDEKILSKIGVVSKEIKEINESIVELDKVIEMLRPGKVHMPKGQITNELDKAINKSNIENQLQKILEAKENYFKEIEKLRGMTLGLEDKCREVSKVKGLLDAEGIQEINDFAHEMSLVMTPNKIYDSGFAATKEEITCRFGNTLSNYSLAIRLLSN